MSKITGNGAIGLVADIPRISTCEGVLIALAKRYSRKRTFPEFLRIQDRNL
jgi:hypothetical protein